MSGLACGVSRAEVIRWNEPEGQEAETRLAALDTAVLRYDARGRLIVSAQPAPEEESREGEGEAVRVSYSADGVAAPAEVLPAIRLRHVSGLNPEQQLKPKTEAFLPSVAPATEPTSSSINRSAAKPISSRKRSASGVSS